MSVPEIGTEVGVHKVILNKADGTSETLIDLSDATMYNDPGGEYANRILKGETAYGSTGIKITGTMPSVAGGTYSPSTSSVTIAGAQYLTSNIVFNACSGTKSITSTAATSVAGYANAQVSDSNLTAANIAEGVTILGVTGTHGSGAQIYTQDLYVSSRTQTVTFASMGFMPKYWCVLSTLGCLSLSSSYSNVIAAWNAAVTNYQGLIFTLNDYIRNDVLGISEAAVFGNNSATNDFFDYSISDDYKLTITLSDNSDYNYSFSREVYYTLLAVG